MSEQLVPQDLEANQVALWRLEQFRALGFSAEDAFRLATSNADLQLTRSLIAAECPHHLAVRIVV